jgi:hypothetical protein
MNTTTISNVDNESLDLSEQVSNAFTAAVADIRKNISQYVSSPTYFTRKRKISLEKLIEYLVILGTKDSRSEICEYYVGDDQDEPSDAAMCMQRDKLKADALIEFWKCSRVSSDLKRTSWDIESWPSTAAI